MVNDEISKISFYLFYEQFFLLFQLLFITQIELYLAV